MAVSVMTVNYNVLRYAVCFLLEKLLIWSLKINLVDKQILEYVNLQQTYSYIVNNNYKKSS